MTTVHRSTAAAQATPPRPVEQLSARLKGPVLLPGQDQYARELDGFDQSVTHHPAFVVAAADADDVVQAVRFAREHRLGVAVQNTGHGIAIPADEGALLISTSRMDGFQVDPERRTARLDAGVLWQDVIPAAADHGLAPLNGSAPFVGAVSYILGGGIGVLSRELGYAADHVRWIEVVTADGTLSRVSAQEQPDLFWALRGGKGNFGVVTALEIDLFPISRLYGGGLYFPAEATPDVLHAYRRWATADTPDELSSSFAMIPFPDLPIVPEPLRGVFATHVRIAYLGTAERGAELLAPLRAVAAPLLDTVGEMPYARVADIHGDMPISGSYYINTYQLTELAAGTVDALLAHAGPESAGLIGVEVRHLGGALSRPAATPGAVARTPYPFQLYSASALGYGQDDEVHAAHAELVSALAPWHSPLRTLNFMAGVAYTDPADVREAFTAEAYARLVAVKSSVDPDNVFRFNHNIPPLAAETQGSQS